MSIIQLPIALPAQEGILPATKKMIVTDDVGTVTTAGYLNAENLQGFSLNTTDIIEMLYSFDVNTSVGTFGTFSVEISDGVITLNIENTGDISVVGTPTANHIAQWASASSLQDGGVLGQAAAKAVTSNSDAKVVSFGGSSTSIGFLAQYQDTVGTIAGGIDPTTLQTVASISANQVSFAGGATTFDYANAFFTTNSVSTVSFVSQTSPAYVLTAAPTAGHLTLTFNTDPGASVLSIIAFDGNQN